jgi:hypothetical protein
MRHKATLRSSSSRFVVMFNVSFAFRVVFNIIIASAGGSDKLGDERY